MKTLAYSSLRLLRAAALTVVFISFTASAAPPPQVKVVAAQRRNDLTAAGSSQRIGMLRQQQRVQRMIEKQTQAPGSKQK